MPEHPAKIEMTRPARGSLPIPRRAGLVVLAAALGWTSPAARAMPGAPAGVVETGAPSFVVLGPEALGLSAEPVNLHVLPDGRVLVVAPQELAFGDGVRWETFREADNQQPIYDSVAVGQDGRIYVGTGGAIDRVDFSADARWHFTPATALPQDPVVKGTTLVSVEEFPDQWYWYGGNGAVVSWRPGQTPRLAGHIGAIQRIFTLGTEVYVSEQSSGGLFRLTSGAAEPVRAAKTLVSESVTCAIPFGPGEALVGTASVGLKLFDGKTFRPFGPPGLLNGTKRITDLCAAGAGFYAAAIDTVGIVFFDRSGRTVQVLDRILDHRLARVQSLTYARDGVLWALLNEGVARVKFPDPISQFEPLVPSGLAFARPLRHDGKLWIFADGRAMRGVYSAHGRLEQFVDDTPPGRYLFTMADVAGRLVACNDEGIYVDEAAGWKRILAGVVNGRIVTTGAAGNKWYYVARGEYGTIERVGDDYVARRISRPDLGDSYGAKVDAAGVGWLELGTNHVGRFDPRGEHLRLDIFGPASGLTDGWVEIYALDGVARFHTGNRLFRFDEAAQRFVEDRELLAKLPQLASAGGRPVTDSFGRLWYTAEGTAHVVERSAGGGWQAAQVVPVGFAPTNYTAEKDGVIWMFEKQRLVRMDLRLPAAPSRPLEALITAVQLTASGQWLFAPGAGLAPLSYADNSMVIQFAAPANPFGRPVTFEVLLEGSGAQWTSTGAVGSVAFNRLKEGSYVFHVRPVAAGGVRGAEARLAFTVLPPWYRTTTAWASYVLAAAGLIGFVTLFPSYLQRREKERLALLVTERTAELNASNARLGRQIAETTEKSAALSASEERFRLLNAGLEKRVEERTRELSREQARFKFIFEAVPVGFTWMRQKDVASRIVNPAHAAITGVPVERCHELDLYRAATHPDDRARQDALHARLLRGEIDHYENEKRYVHPDGTVRWGALAVRLYRDAAGETQEINTLFDITERKQAEAELAAASGLLEAMLENTPDMIYFKDRASQLVRFSKAFSGRFELDPATMRGKTDFDLFAPEHAQPAFDDEQEIVRTGEPIIGKLEKETYADGHVTWALTTKMPWRDATGAIVGTFGISKDVTAWKQAETQLAETHKQLLETSRQAGMAEVATGVLHNVGNVLNSVNVSATLVADHVRHSKAQNVAKVAALFAQHRTDLPEFLTTDTRGRMIPDYLGTLAEMLQLERDAVMQELENLRKNVDHIKDIVAMQQSYARTSGVIETVSVPDMVEDAVRINAGSLVRHDVNLVRDYQARPVVTTDKHKVMQILINLVRNAKYACDESGRREKTITLRTGSNEHGISIAVIDNGVGIPAENLTRIFNHGFTTRRHGHGFGLHSGALAARELGGALTAQSDGPGQGATFLLELPYKPGNNGHEPNPS